MVASDQEQYRLTFRGTVTVDCRRSREPQELGSSSFPRDASDVENMMNRISSQHQYPFDTETVTTVLVNNVTGHIAAKCVKDAQTVKVTAKLKMTSFTKQRVVKSK